MLPTHRRDKILELLQEHGSAKVPDLAKPLKITGVSGYRLLVIGCVIDALNHVAST